MGRRKDPNKLSDDLIAALKGAASRVNTTLPNYEPGYVSASRTAEISDRETCDSLEEFVEIRFNRECLDIPELSDAAKMSNGHLFVCRELSNPDIKSRKYDQALVTLIEESDIDAEVDKIIKKKDDINLGVEQIRHQYPEIVHELRASLEKGISMAKGVLKGCTKFKFNSVKQKIKITNEKNKKL